MGQRGGSPCDVIPESDEIYDLVCRTPPANVADAERCNETWYNFTTSGDFYRQFYESFGGGAGGGGSLVRARNKMTKVFDSFPIVIVGGGGGTAAVLHYDVVEDIGASNIFLSNHIAYRTLINGHFRSSDEAFSIYVGSRGFRYDSSATVAGAGGGYSAGLFQTINVDGKALSRPKNFAEGGRDCTQLFFDAGAKIPYFRVHGWVICCEGEDLVEVVEGEEGTQVVLSCLLVRLFLEGVASPFSETTLQQISHLRISV